METRGRKKKPRPIGPDWYESSVACFQLDKIDRIVDRATTPKNTFNSMKRALLDAEMYYDLTGGEPSKAILFVGELILIV